MHSKACWLLAAAAVATAACSSEEATGPTLTAEIDPTNFDSVLLRWTDLGLGEASSYLLEGRIGSGAFEAVNEFPPGYTVFPLYLGDLPELLDLEFRVTVLLDGLPVARTHVAAVRRGLRPPRFASAWVQEGFVLVQWWNGSTVADSLVLERRTVQPDGATSEWTSIPIPFPSDSYLDPIPSSLFDGARLEYALAAAKGSERSAPATAMTYPALLLSPAFLSATSSLGGVRLAFENRSAYATEIVVERSDGAGGTIPLAILPASATTYDDFPGPPGLYTYLLTARLPPETAWPTTSATVSRGGIVAPPPEWGLAATMATVPPGDAAARAPSGAFATVGRLGGSGYGVFYVAPGEDRSGALRTVDGTRAWQPGVVLDAGGHPHAVYAAPGDPGNPVPIVHAWHDGAAWRSEEIARRVLSGGDATQIVRFDVGADGTLHASWQAGPDPALGLEVASRVDGTWKLENVSLALGAPYQVRWVNHFVAGDGAGQPHLVVVDWDHTLRHFRRGGSGWEAEDVPTGGAVSVLWGDFYPFALLAGDAWIAAVYRDEGSTELKLLERTPAGWGGPLTLGTGVSDYRAARSADGTRVIAAAKVAAGTGIEGRVWIREGGSVAEKRWFTSLYSAFAAGFDAGGKAWVLDGWASDVTPPAATVEAVLFEEP